MSSANPVFSRCIARPLRAPAALAHAAAGLLLAVCCLLALPATALATTVDGTPLVVSLGDSYSSGEGNEPFYSQDSSDKYDIEDWYAHRSELSWPGRLQIDGVKLSDVKDSGWYFLASSGAVAANVYETEQEKDVDEDNYTPDSSTTKYVGVQLDSAESYVNASSLTGEAEVDYVTITIGGNDLEFSGIITKAYLGNGFINRDYLVNYLNEVWYKNDGTVLFPTASNASSLASDEDLQEEIAANGYAKDRIATCYSEIQSTFSSATIIVAGYPQLLSEDAFGFSAYEAKIINSCVSLFNSELKLLVSSASLSGADIYFVSVEELFEGHEVGTDDPYLYDVEWFWNDEELNRGLSSAYSLHPNTTDDDTGESVLSAADVNSGVTAYAWAVQQKINELEQAERDVVMLLDVSSSMSGDPIASTKEAAASFVDMVLEYDARTALVTFGDSSEELLGFSANKSTLQEAISGITASGNTNMEAGMASAASMLSGSSSEDQYIVLMSDGLPNEGLTGDELIAYAEQIRDPDGDGTDEVTIFVLGFNEGYDGQELLRQIASDGCYYSVQDAEDLEGFFADMADSINGVRYTYVSIACPVDVTVSYNGETLSSAGDDPVTRTSFGTLTFEESDGEDSGDDDVDTRVKVLRLVEGPSYEITITGTGTGSMDYTIGFLDEDGSYSDFRRFEGVTITEDTVVTTVAELTSSTLLEVDEDGDGVIDLRYRAGENEHGELVDSSTVVLAVVVGYCVVLLLTALLLLRRVVGYLRPARS